jgi:hypothetical protein
MRKGGIFQSVELLEINLYLAQVRLKEGEMVKGKW